MDDRYNTKRLLSLRRLTRGIAEMLRAQLKDHLATLSSLTRPRSILGDHVAGGVKESVKGGESAFHELRTLWETVAVAKPFGMPKDLTSPIDVISSQLELSPVEQSHEARTDSQTKSITVTSPLRWILNFSGCAPKRLRECLADRTRAGAELNQCLLHCLLVHLVFTRQTGVTRLLEALQFPVTTGRMTGLGELPITYISSTLTTERPPDDVLIENTEISGMNVFEEVVDLDQILALKDPLQARLLDVARAQASELLPPA